MLLYYSTIDVHSSTICMGDSRFVRIPTPRDMSLCDALSATSYAVNGTRTTCGGEEHDCTDVMDQVHDLQKLGRRAGIDKIILSTGGNDYMFCRRNGISLKACSNMISNPLIEIMRHIKESDACIAGNHGEGCTLFVLGAYILPRLQFSIHDAEIIDFHLQRICRHTGLCVVVTVKQAGLSANQDFLEDQIHLRMSGIRKLQKVILPQLRNPKS